jgi:TetR/AcrR family transcriptional regulator, lmrAB and yxaGH operons repressor
MPAAVIPRDEAVSRILAVFRQYGYDGASLSRLSEATGLGRSSLYHHFPNGKVDMAQAAVASVRAWLGENVFSALEGEAPPETRLKRFAAKILDFYSHGKSPCLTDLFTMGDAGEIFREGFSKSVRVLIQAIAAVVQEAGISKADAARRAEDAVIAIQGSLVVSRAMGNTAPFLRVMKEMPGKLLG